MALLIIRNPLKFAQGEIIQSVNHCEISIPGPMGFFELGRVCFPYPQMPSSPATLTQWVPSKVGALRNKSKLVDSSKIHRASILCDSCLSVLQLKA